MDDLVTKPTDLTTCCVLTGPGRSAVAVVGLAGPDVQRLMTQFFHAASPGALRVGQIRFGRWQGTVTRSGEEPPAESVVVSAVSNQQLEVHCHGGVAAVGRIIADLESMGTLVIHADDWETDHVPWLIREASVVLQRCTTKRTAAYAMGEVRGRLHQWTTHLINQASAIDGTSDVAFQLLSGAAANAQAMIRMAAWSSRLDVPFRVVLAGAPNVGKSSLINAIVGYDRSITMNEAGTTRDILHADTVLDGLPIQLTDTAGIRDLSAYPVRDLRELNSHAQVELAGIRQATEQISQADLIIHVVDDDDVNSENALPELGKRSNVIRVRNKCDQRRAGSSVTSKDQIETIATTGHGVDELCEAIATALVPETPNDDQPIAINQRQVDRLQKIVDASDPRELISLLENLRGRPVDAAK